MTGPGPRYSRASRAGPVLLPVLPRNLDALMPLISLPFTPIAIPPGLRPQVCGPVTPTV